MRVLASPRPPERIPTVELATDEIGNVDGFAEVDLYQRREKIFTRFVGGFYQRLRFFTGWPLLTGYFLLPWLQWQGRQAVLFDLPARQFHIFGLTFWPEDLWLLGWMLIISAFALFTVTTIVGRLWCGYTCPQTVWTAIFMWIEQRCEGTRNQRIRLDQAPLSWNKAARRSAKHTLWLGVGLLTGLTFVGYFTPIRELSWALLTLNAGGWALFWVGFFTLATYINAGWLREQVCTYMCPYARFQSAMIDKDSLVVTYDTNRGEPRRLRSERRRHAHRLAQVPTAGTAAPGDCVDCSLCVQVCPTGIDIRDGLQYECIGCAHCIDACNQVMAKLDLAQGLIRYSTERALTGGQTRWLRARSVGYALATAAMGIALLIGIGARSTLSIDLNRERGALAQTLADGTTRNDFTLKITNKGADTLTLRTAVRSPGHIALTTNALAPLAPRSFAHYEMTLTAPTQAASAGVAQPVIIEICARSVLRPAASQCVTEETTFFGSRS
ncbi:MAG: cytochrome c oxidase accessory protein CcoG [Pseudomonadota bacterium]